MDGWHQLMTCKQITERGKLLRITMRNRRLGTLKNHRDPMSDEAGFDQFMGVISFILDFIF